MRYLYILISTDKDLNLNYFKGIFIHEAAVFKIYSQTIDLIEVLKTVMYYGYSGISRMTNLLSEEIA